MKLIDKYLLRTILLPLTYCFLAFAMLYVIYDLFDNLPDFVEAKTPVGSLVKFYIYLIPSVLIYITPISLMLAILYGLSQLTKNNELTAMRASGLSLFRLVVPLVGIGFAASVVVAFINEAFGPSSSYWCHQFVRQERHKGRMDVHIRPNLAHKNEVTRRIWMIDEFNTATFDMKNVSVIQQRRDGSDEAKIQAQQGRWLDGRWWFMEVVTQPYDKNGSPMGQPRFEPRREMTDFKEVPADFLNEVKDPEYLSALELLKFLKTHKRMSADSVARVRVDFHHRLAMPWTCLVVTLIGIPFGAQTGRKGAFLGTLLAIGLFFSFYILVNLGLALGKKGAIDPWVAGWFPNLFFLCCSSVLVWRMR
ncbi:MAG: LptF/LptG family permease [Verrucomicrobiota bacterium]